MSSDPTNSKSKDIDIEDIDKETNTAKNESREAKIPQLTNFSPAMMQESIRSWISLVIFGNALVIIFLVAVFILHPIIFPKEDNKTAEQNKNLIKLGNQTFIYVVKDDDDQKGSRELINLLWTSQITLMSGTIAFYFASQNLSKNQ
ncbi:MAG: hypothetical protein RMZ41_030285 [Nostoc sp. DedVER02]|uniref:hypothetical protein n=1 Tax=unclassified Nostoc TaxID=2593658 RepID=UPI002AD3EA44|nr:MULTISPECIES: hypothetical protein [unclassified Nostoc]MDZ7987570.1 hypothetical protein [Nostoc sp. DedVER02]MDZ8116343.1 hypothetical protein [Nostoc sp. DedVER01b]